MIAFLKKIYWWWDRLPYVGALVRLAREHQMFEEAGTEIRELERLLGREEKGDHRLEARFWEACNELKLFPKKRNLNVLRGGKREVLEWDPVEEEPRV